MHDVVGGGRSPQGECGLKFSGHVIGEGSAGRSPQGECGLKLVGWPAHDAGLVAPRKGSVD